MKKRQGSPQKTIDFVNTNNLDISIPEDGENAPLILGVTSSSVVQSTLTAYLIDLGYRVAGPFSNIMSGSSFFDQKLPDIVIFDVTSNKEELNSLIVLLKMNSLDIPILLISNDPIHINHPYQSKIRLPLNPHDLAEEIQKLHKDQKAYNTPVHKILNFINKLFLKMIEISPNNLRPIIERSINKAIFEFCTSNNDFTRVSEESLSIIIKDASFTNITDLLESLHYSIQNFIDDLNSKFDSKIGYSLINDALESIILSGITIPPYIRDLIAKLGIDSTRFKHLIDTIVPKLEDHKKSCFVAFLSMGDMGPELITHVSNDENISVGLSDGVASQIVTLVGQGSSYHVGIYGPIPIPTANNIVGMIWSKMLRSNIKDHRMEGHALSVAVIGFYRELLTYLPSHDTMKSIFGLLDNINHVDEVTKDLLSNLQEKFLDCFH
ncbi:MAG: hypothetical protein ACW99A_23025 [Candidatus Kariarchaeaceae archaeon]|jgi:hypothetical protein